MKQIFDSQTNTSIIRDISENEQKHLEVSIKDVITNQWTGLLFMSA